MASCRQGRHQASNQDSTGFGLKNFFRAPPARSAGKPMEHSYRYRLRFGTRSGCQNFRASFQGFSKTSKRRTEAYRMHVGTDFLKMPPVTGQYWSLFQCSMLGTGGTCGGATRGRKCYVTPTFSGIPNKGDKIKAQKKQKKQQQKFSHGVPDPA